MYGALGDLDRAYEYLYRALDEQPHGLYYLAADPAADPLRTDPRWEGILTRLRASSPANE